MLYPQAEEDSAFAATSQVSKNVSNSSPTNSEFSATQQELDSVKSSFAAQAGPLFQDSLPDNSKGTGGLFRYGRDVVSQTNDIDFIAASNLALADVRDRLPQAGNPVQSEWIGAIEQTLTTASTDSPSIDDRVAQAASFVSDPLAELPTVDPSIQQLTDSNQILEPLSPQDPIVVSALTDPSLIVPFILGDNAPQPAGEDPLLAAGFSSAIAPNPELVMDESGEPPPPPTNPTEPQLPSNFTESSSWSLGINITVTKSGGMSASAIPVANPTDATGYELDFEYSENSGLASSFGVTTAAAQSSGSGSGVEQVPAGGIFFDFNSQNPADANGLSIEPPVPLPELGNNGHSSSSSSNSSSTVGSSSNSSLSLKGKVSSDGRLSGISGRIRDKMNEALADSASDNGITSVNLSEAVDDDPPEYGGDDAVIITGTHYSYLKRTQDGSDLIQVYTRDLATGTLVLGSSISMVDEAGGESNISGTYTPANWDPRTRYEHAIDGSPDPNPGNDVTGLPPLPEGYVYPTLPDMQNTWLAALAGRRGDAFEQTVNFGAGVSDSLTMELTSYIRAEVLNGFWNDTIDYDGGTYRIGHHGTTAVMLATGGPALIKGAVSGLKALRAAASNFDELGKCANMLTKLVRGGCFVAGTPVTVSELPYSSGRQAKVWSEPDWLDSSNELSPWGESELVVPVRGLQSRPDAVPSTLLAPLRGEELEVRGSSLQTSFLLPIEDVPLGSRIPTKNPRPWEYDDSLPEPDQAAWAKLSITMYRTDGGIVDAELIRHRSWIKSVGIEAGKLLPMNIEELQVHGSALVTSVDDCPEIAGGEGSVVTARFTTREVHTIAVVEILGPDGQIETLEGTTIHPVWSEDRQDWVPVRFSRNYRIVSLSPFRSIRSRAILWFQLGLDEIETSAVLSVTILTTSIPVYNIQVHGEHVYQVGELTELASRK